MVRPETPQSVFDRLHLFRGTHARQDQRHILAAGVNQHTSDDPKFPLHADEIDFRHLTALRAPVNGNIPSDAPDEPGVGFLDRCQFGLDVVKQVEQSVGGQAILLRILSWCVEIGHVVDFVEEASISGSECPRFSVDIECARELRKGKGNIRTGGLALSPVPFHFWPEADNTVNVRCGLGLLPSLTYIYMYVGPSRFL